MDVQMARTGSLEASRRILATDRAARVLNVTTDDDAHWRAAAREADACGYVLKENLLEVRRLLASSGGCAPANDSRKAAGPLIKKEGIS